MNPSIEFRLGDVLTDSDYDVALARLLIVSRQASALRHALGVMRKEPEPNKEREIVLFGYYLGVLKELLDAFHHMHSRGYLRHIESDQCPFPDLNRDVCTAIAQLDKTNPESLYSRLLKRVRDNAAFHVSLNSVKQALIDLQNLSFPAAVTVGEQQNVLGVPFALASLVTIILKDVNDLNETMDTSVRLHLAIEAVAHDLYLIKVRIKTELPTTNDNSQEGLT